MVLDTDVLKLLHGSIAVGNRDGEPDKAALADFGFYLDCGR
jgi:hypothetical protein